MEKPCYLFTLSRTLFELLGELIELKREEHLNNEQISIMFHFRKETTLLPSVSRAEGTGAYSRQ